MRVVRFCMIRAVQHGVQQTALWAGGVGRRLSLSERKSHERASVGPAAFIGFVKWLRGEYPKLSLDIKRVIAEADMVATHSHLILVPGAPGRAVADFFRLENGKVVEHWDVIQDVPEASANANGMF